MSDVFPTAKAIEITDDEVSQAKKYIREHLRKFKNVRGNLSTYINKIIKDCKDGWGSAPDNFKDRVYIKLGLQLDGTPHPPPYKDRPKAEISELGKQAAVKRIGQSILDETEWFDIKVALTENERKFMEERMRKYLMDFELNESSDLPIIRQIIVEEILQRRIQEEVLKAARGETTRGDIVKLLNDSYERMSSAQDLLGISGKQRAGKRTSMEGSIAELNLQYVKTLEEFPDLETKWEAEELLLLLRKYIRGELREQDFINLANMNVDQAKIRYDEFIQRGLLDKEKDILELDNFGRKIADDKEHFYEPILKHLSEIPDEEIIDEGEASIEETPKEIPVVVNEPTSKADED